MKVFVAKLSKEKLSFRSESERVFFLSIAHLANEIRALLKLTFWVDKSPEQTDAEINGRVVLTFMLIKLLAGKLKEGHELLQTKYFGSGLSREYNPLSREDGEKALQEIKKYFGKPNLIEQIRNNYAFHYSPGQLDMVLPSVPEKLELYIEQEGSANNLYYFAEALANRALLQDMGDGDDFVAYKRLMSEVPKVANWFSRLCDALLYEFLNRMDEGIWEGYAEEVKFGKLPSFLDIRIPWFTEPSEVYRKYR